MKPLDDLFGKVINRVHKERRILAIRRRIMLYSALFIMSVTAVIPAANILIAESAESGFFQFISLIFTDSNVILVYLQSFSLALLEALPAVGLLAVLSVTLVFLWSLKNLTLNIKNILILNV